MGLRLALPRVGHDGGGVPQLSLSWAMKQVDDLAGAAIAFGDERLLLVMLHPGDDEKDHAEEEERAEDVCRDAVGWGGRGTQRGAVFETWTPFHGGSSGSGGKINLETGGSEHAAGVGARVLLGADAQLSARDGRAEPL